MSAESSSEKTPAETLDVEFSEDQVRAYLKEHNDFFERHPDMLDHIAVSHRSGGAVSLVEKQVSVLRDRNMEMRKRLNSLTSNARENDRLYELTRKLVLKLLDAEDREALSRCFLSAMRDDFDVEHVSFILFGDADAGGGRREEGRRGDGYRVDSPERARIEVGALIKAKVPVCGTLRGEELRYLFPDAGKVGSAAVVPLVKGCDLGIIAVGSNDPHHYSASMGTVFLTHIADVIVRRLPQLGHQAPDQAG